MLLSSIFHLIIMFREGAELWWYTLNKVIDLKRGTKKQLWMSLKDAFNFAVVPLTGSFFNGR